MIQLIILTARVIVTFLGSSCLALAGVAAQMGMHNAVATCAFLFVGMFIIDEILEDLQEYLDGPPQS